MRIAVPSMGEDKESNLSSTLGRCRFIVIYDSDSKKYFSSPNPGISLIDGSGIKAVEVIVKSHTDILLTKGIGVKAYSVLAKGHIPVLMINAVSSIDEAVRKYLKNKR
jgi:predicted Fe-Mo cluster-binding NifX family protein